MQATVPKLEPEIFGCVYWAKAVQTVERVMQAYGLMVNLTIEQEDDAHERFEIFLQTREGNEQELAVQALQFLRGNRPGQQRPA